MSGHYYFPDATPCHQVKGCKGQMVDTDIRHVRKFGLYPSVTTAMDIHVNQGLIDWKHDQVIKACLENPYTKNKTPEKWKSEIRTLSKKIQNRTAEQGTIIHKALEKAILGKGITKAKIIRPALEFLYDYFGDEIWIPEQTFATTLNDCGYGGSVDLHSRSGKGIVIDWKTKELDDLSKIKLYEKWCMQLSGYRYGLLLPEAECYNIIISTTKPGVVRIHKWSQDDLGIGLDKYYLLLKYWYLHNKVPYLSRIEYE